MLKYDILVIGSGVAGITYALKVAQKSPNYKVAIITKSDENESNTKYAQGGVAVVLDKLKDSFKSHIQDTLRAGDGLCNLEAVSTVVTEGPAMLETLITWGVNFDKNKVGKLHFGLEGGHSKHRVVHHKDITGFEIEQKLLAEMHRTPNIDIFSQHFAIELITEHHFKNKFYKKEIKTCFGAYILNSKTNKIETFLSKITLLATGGVGQVYQNTTNPIIATGDGIAMAKRAGARIENMAFIQFHPTALYYPQINPSFLISEAVRGFGALLKNKHGKRFMDKYDNRNELASRDIVSRAIDNELKQSGDECVYLDCRHLDLKAFKNHFPNILKQVNDIGIDLATDMIPVVPAAHYLCGGIKVNLHGQTNVNNLFACGECACTGLHGANRLASNSLLEALVFARRCYLKSIALISNINKFSNAPNWNNDGTTNPKELILITHNRHELQSLMRNYGGIIRSDECLKRAEKRLQILFEETEVLYKKSIISPQLLELRNMIVVASLIISQSQKLKENKGTFYKI